MKALDDNGVECCLTRGQPHLKLESREILRDRESHQPQWIKEENSEEIRK
jgi:hypothetical protein